ncbi:MAG: T9SS type A sorting domain-containing protein [Bacteroidota bacterium]
MRKHFIGILLCWGVSWTISAQNCLPSGIILSTQTQMDGFIFAFPDCDSIGGNVTIAADADDPIVDLSSLHNIVAIGGDLTISNHIELNSLEGLNQLAYVGGSLHLTANQQLSELLALQNLREIGGLIIAQHDSLQIIEGFAQLLRIHGDLIIEDNPLLQEIRGFEQVDSLLGNSFFLDNPMLHTIDGFDGLLTIGGDLEVKNNSVLTTIQAWSNVQQIGLGLRIRQNEQLSALPPFTEIDSIGESLSLISLPLIPEIPDFPDLVFIGGSLDISALDLVEDLDGFAALKHTQQWLITENLALQSIDSLSQIDPGSIQSLTINFCPELSICALENICSYLELEIGVSDFDTNGTGCNDEQEILDICNPPINAVTQVPGLHITTYPNPTKGILHWSGPSVEYFRLYDAQGSLLQMIESPGSTIQLSVHSSGIYWAQWTIDGASHLEKIWYTDRE